MDTKKALSLVFSVAFSLGLFVSGALSEVIIIIEPDPEPIIDPITPPTEPPVVEPPAPPQPLGADINVDPNVINLKSNRNYITAYIELASDISAAEIKVSSVKVTTVNGTAITPVSALLSPTAIGDENANSIPDLMVKFNYDELKPYFSEGPLTISISGELNNGTAFSGENTVKATYHESNGNSNQQTVNTQSAVKTEKNFKFTLGNNVPAGAYVRKALVWEQKLPKLEAQKELWWYKAEKNWQAILGHLSNESYSNVLRGTGYEWDVINELNENRTLGLNEVVVRLDNERKNTYPVLVLVCDTPSQDAEERMTASMYGLNPIGEKAKFVKKGSNPDKTITLYYNESDLRGEAESDLKIYYWSEAVNEWQVAPDCTIDYADNSISCQSDVSTFYRIMAVKPAPAQPEEAAPAAPNTLKQNYPNPFNPATTIEYSVSQDCHVTLKLYNVAGELVATIVDEFQYAGSHSVYYDGGERLSRGIYFYQLIAGNFVDTRRMAVLK
ncbi:MAG TPA: hypothetical protein DEE98_07450 [Elusimicrobia bacterium]|nr:MAG: hypothetical protein A2278_00300 [Elusimicrobia bacterium RIFOXYA12_FULL_49_49]OGS09811.1 MAG: hypothetical protein A2204_04730 [Elusimicrobia bacterium RIFOXYA1_FULL_47_7]OGS10837.1 MAG: hypothetical protein A2386_03365 [Elusimicrobia bacterium RIFOXYB1_FULL_48_9]OGS15102.1 MAG: hypothetical protein A2251_00310 [Elusimicrobia bacterium RIFOXYA2_FULL_47_53]OGS29722.1 MAG: hypothetical protein A2323_01110 [Elusimicrobia bacterium RIFOXYB2_FULL_46_23]HBU70198.1 hypothetical protein [Elus